MGGVPFLLIASIIDNIRILFTCQTLPILDVLEIVAADCFSRFYFDGRQIPGFRYDKIDFMSRLLKFS